MKVLAINNGKDITAYTFIKRDRGSGYLACSDFLKGNTTEGIKDLCRQFQPEQIVLQLPPTGLDECTQRAIQEGFGRNIAAAYSLGRHPIMKNLLRTRAAFGCYRREDVRKRFEQTLKFDCHRNINRRQHMQLINTILLAYDSLKAAELNITQ
jgi:hypothetical protein